MKTGRAANIRLEPSYPNPLAGVLSYLVPGLGQIVQGRIAKGVLFLVCLYGLFFYGMYLGHFQNVYIYDPQVQQRAAFQQGAMFGGLADRARFIAQAWIGVVAWPAVIQHFSYDPASLTGHPIFGHFQRMPSEQQMIELLRDNDKRPDLGWVYTVIAGVLNILVIYDAYAGPVFTKKEEQEPEKEDSKEDPDT